MTPTKAFLIFGLQLWSLDFADHATLICIAANDDQLDWLVASLKQFHTSVPFVKVENGSPISKFAGVKFDG